ncbi:energy-coupling factor ABC transporter ATP-binding protein [Glutamicibacter sp. X7]
MQLPQIRIENVRVQRDERVILEDINLTLDEQRIGIIGSNGAGKSTLSRLLNGLVLPTSGRVLIDDRDTAREAKQIRRDVGFVFQNPANQIIMPIVLDDICFGLKNLQIPRAQRKPLALLTLDRLGLGHLAERESHTLSGGEQQMIALAAVLAMNPKTIVFDEPTTMLDLRNRNAFRQEIAKLDQQTIVVTHDLELLADFDRVLVVTDGRIAFDGAPQPAVDHYRQWSHV